MPALGIYLYIKLYKVKFPIKKARAMAGRWFLYSSGLFVADAFKPAERNREPQSSNRRRGGYIAPNPIEKTKH